MCQWGYLVALVALVITTYVRIPSREMWVAERPIRLWLQQKLRTVMRSQATSQGSISMLLDSTFCSDSKAEESMDWFA